MAAKKGGRRNGNVRDLTVEILKDIRGELVGLRGDVVMLRQEHGARLERIETRLEHLETGLERLGTRIDRVEGETARGFRAVTARLEHMVEICTIGLCEADST